MIQTTRAWGVDISRWNSPYKDDGINEGFPDVSFVVQKAFDGLYDYTIGGSAYWQPQYDSLAPIPHKGGYGWYQTELNPIAQADLALKIGESGLYDFIAVDYEAHLNQITKETALDLKRYVDYFKKHSDMKIPVYTNGWILTLLRAWLGDWLNTVDIWIAGGKYYNQFLSTPIDDSIVPEIPEAFTFWQFSADKNEAADEFDFGQNERASLDINIYNGTEPHLANYLGKTSTIPTPPPTTPSYTEGWNAALNQVEVKIKLLRV